jgi:hypothetical protein
MKKTTVFTISILSLVTLLTMLFTANSIVSAQAATGATGQALEIAPPVVLLKANPGQTITTQISLRDVSKGSLIVSNQINDFEASGENGIPKININTSRPGPYSIVSWINPLSELTLNSKQIKSLPITINVPANASPGGYYGIIRFTATPPELKGTGVSLSASLGALIFIRVNGEAKENLTVASFTASDGNKTGWLFESTPIQFDIRLKNNGNMFEQPVGVISITDMFNKKIADVNVNLPQNYILPQSIRKFSQILDSSQLGNRWLFGKYKAELKLTYGANNQTLTQNLTFWVIPWRLILVIIVVLIGVIIALYYTIKRYNRYVIKRAQGHRSKHK